jgi:hypothetical protein
MDRGQQVRRSQRGRHLTVLRKWCWQRMLTWREAVDLQARVKEFSARTRGANLTATFIERPATSAGYGATGERPAQRCSTSEAVAANRKANQSAPDLSGNRPKGTGDLGPFRVAGGTTGLSYLIRVLIITYKDIFHVNPRVQDMNISVYSRYYSI